MPVCGAEARRLIERELRQAYEEFARLLPRNHYVDLGGDGA